MLPRRLWRDRHNDGLGSSPRPILRWEHALAANYYKPEPERAVFGPANGLQITLAHPTEDRFPNPDLPWKQLGMNPIGAIREGTTGVWRPLALNAERDPYVVLPGVSALIDRDEVVPLLFDAVVGAASKIWGSEWNASLSTVFQINRRTFQRDRFIQYLLPPAVIQQIAYVAARSDHKEFGEALRAVSVYDKRIGDELTVRQEIAAAVDFFYDRDEATDFN